MIVKENLLSSRNVVVVSDNYRLLGDRLLWRQDGELILQGNVQGVFPASVFTIFALCSFIASCVFYAANTKATESVEVNADNARYAPEGNIAVFSGNVFVKAQGWALVADALTVSVDADNNRSYKASGNPLRVSGEVEGQSIVANAALFKSSNDNASF